MRNRTAALLLVLSMCPVPGLMAHAEGANADTTWMTVLLGGRKIGHLEIEHQRTGDVVTTTQTLVIELNRNGTGVPMGVTTHSTESAAGEPLAFYSRSSLSSSDSTVEGKRQSDGNFAVSTSVGGETRMITLSWPPGAVLSEGQRLALVKAAGHPGEHYEMSMFDPASQAVARVDMEVIGNERVVLPDGPRMLNHQRQVLQTPRGAQTMDLWLDEQGMARKGTLQMLGHELEMLACNKACAMAPVQNVDMFRVAMVDSPRLLPPEMRNDFLRYRIHMQPGAPQPVINTDEQHVTRLGASDWVVDVGNAQPGGESPPDEQDTLPNAWVQSDAPAIRQLATRAVGGASDDLQKMRRLRSFVSDYITQHGLDVGYASALEVVRTREGDCTEYAVLLAALARAENIPTRVVTGMVYADRFAGSSRVFVPHAWVQSWINGRWQSFDAALRRFDSSHIALDTGDGDPWHFFNAASLFGQMRIEEISPAWQLAGNTPPSVAAEPPASPGGRP
ncbi:transglutaminase domain-containing protein [Dyella solisilvae]|uniref:Transglutaminase domain-containing protein n=1 Tax=Dyella solisilvae TaxID=1920168 RepID=A0A370K7E5_9GAMM|nr:transglutaminase-like domain-containing protein [Dyella solisilvae]RDI97950.1 transglutaminase domain-containing protein [Dyella solisilvae]